MVNHPDHNIKNNGQDDAENDRGEQRNNQPEVVCFDLEGAGQISQVDQASDEQKDQTAGSYETTRLHTLSDTTFETQPH